MSGPDAVSTTALTRAALSADPAVASGQNNAFEGEALAADGHSPIQMDRDLVNEARGLHSLPPSAIHELRTPLTSIHGYAQILQRNLANPDRAHNAVHVISRESVRLVEMLALLSEMSELESGALASPPFAVEVRHVVEGTMRGVERQDNGRRPLSVEGAGLALCNPSLLSRALLHVLTNAVRYSDTGQPVAATINVDADDVEISISDCGIGIPQGEHGSVFQPYVRGSNAKEHGVRGLGLGLYLAREGLRQTGGRIDAEPGLTVGTVVRISLPQA